MFFGQHGLGFGGFDALVLRLFVLIRLPKIKMSRRENDGHNWESCQQCDYSIMFQSEVNDPGHRSAGKIGRTNPGIIRPPELP